MLNCESWLFATVIGDVTELPEVAPGDSETTPANAVATTDVVTNVDPGALNVTVIVIADVVYDVADQISSDDPVPKGWIGSKVIPVAVTDVTVIATSLT